MSADLSRWQRQVVLPEVGVNGQAVLRDSHVTVIGLGGLGSAAVLYLAGAGIGRLTLADRDRVEPGNLQRQVLYRSADIGQPKTAAARAQVAALDASIAVDVHEGTLTPEILDRLARASDVVLDCTDNFPTRHAINAACVRTRRPLVSGAAIRFEGQLAVFDPRRADGACYACLYPDAGEPAERCEDAGVLGPVVGVVGALQALAALKLLLGRGDDVNRLRRWNALDMAWRAGDISRDPHCPVCRPRP